MLSLRLWSLFGFFTISWAGATAGAGSIKIYRGEEALKQEVIFHSAQGDVSSPDVSLSGACAADLYQHCRHLLSKDLVLRHKPKPKPKKHHNSASVAQVIDNQHPQRIRIDHNSLVHNVTIANTTTEAEKPPSNTTSVAAAAATQQAANATAAPAQTDSSGSSGGATTNTTGPTKSATPATNTTGTTVAASTADTANISPNTTSSANTTAASDAASSTDTTTTAAANATIPTQINATTTPAPATATDTAAATDTATATDTAAATDTATAMDAAADSAAAATTAAANNQKSNAVDTAAADQQQQNQAAAQTQDAAAATVLESATAADTAASLTTAAAEAARHRSRRQLLADEAATAATNTNTPTTTTTAADSAQSTESAESAAAFYEDDLASSSQHDHQDEKDQTQDPQQQQGAGGEGAGGDEAVELVGSAVKAELNAAESHRDDLSEALEVLGLRTHMTSAAMGLAKAPLARCLRGVLHAAEMSISPNIPELADNCKAELRSVLIKRASDVRYDPPLLAACSHDIVTFCEEVGRDTGAVLGCLKAYKPTLLPLCRAAVTSRQAAAAEDMSLDPDLQRACGAEREKLCLEAGWGGGAAQSCLLGHLRGTLPHIFSQLIFPDSAADLAGLDGDVEALEEGALGGADGLPSGAVELSGNCSAALVGRLMEEGEDVRFNYRLSLACAADKQALCRDVRPGGAAVLRCLESHLEHPDMQADCRVALREMRLVRSLDVRLDHTFVSACADDVRSLCGEDVAEQLAAGPADGVDFGLTAPGECLRGRLDLVRDNTCRRHMYETVVAAYQDNRLDAGLMRSCHGEISVMCRQHPARALDCLQEKIDKFSQQDSPAVLRGKVTEPCMAAVMDRKLQAATDVAFLPDLMAACARERAALCSAPGMEGIHVLDCLADHRNSPDFSGRCGDALRTHLAEAARDVRTLAGLQRDCKEEIGTLCRGVQPGEGRVISCLRDNRANITGELCRRQVLRLLGFMVEDHRMDVRLTEACTSDVQKYCAGVEPGNGQVHDCLRRSATHLSSECRDAEEEVEKLEHEDVRLNPKLMRACPVAISSFCGDVPPGDARVIRCLQSHMGRGHFPPVCRAALQQLTDRAATKYSLNYKLNQECEEDTIRLCPDAMDELWMSSDVTGTGDPGAETMLGCLARQAGELGGSCRAELQALVKLSLNRYRVGMPLTSQCDGDVMQHCEIDKMDTPFLQSGFVLSCLAKHAAKLYKPCWELVSSMDDGQFRRAAAAESVVAERQQQLDDELLAQVVGHVRQELEPRLYNTLHEQTTAVARNMSGTLARSLAPKVTALLHTTMSLLVLTALGLLAAGLAARRFLSRGGGLLVVRKDGRV